MILKGQPISFDKQTMPSYIIKFNVTMISFFICWFVVCLPALIAVGAIFGEDAVTYIVMGLLFGVFFVGVFILYIVALKLRERLVAERAAELEEKFYDMPLEKAEEMLRQKGVIKDNGFVATMCDIFAERIVPFDRADIHVYGEGRDCIADGHSVKFRAHPLKIKIYASVFDGVEVLERFATYEMDCALFNFLDKRNLVNYEDNKNFYYLKTDKKNFCRRAFGFRLK